MNCGIALLYACLPSNTSYNCRMVSVYKFSAILFQDVGNIAFEKVCPEMTPADFEKFIEPVVMEYYEHGDSKDVLVSPVLVVDFFCFPSELQVMEY